MDHNTTIFEQERPALLSISYRMLGEISAAEDVVQEAWLRFAASDSERIDNHGAWLRRVATNIALDTLKSARARRESYVGPWLPEPIISEPTSSTESRFQLAQECELALLWAMERLAPTERAAFVLREAFDADYSEIAATLGKSEAACRQMVSRSHKRLQTSGPRFDVPPEEAAKAVETFFFAAKQDHAQAIKMVSKDAVAITDGGGKASAAFRVLYGPQDIITVTQSVMKKSNDLRDVSYALVIANSQPALARFTGGVLDTLTLVLPDSNGDAQWIYVMRNPEKLKASKPLD
ncbi:RNA polymerase sigma factor SigJ [uncultured Shimia sp.]|uniref:RNA polymerase sigma factor SigJ n=1 Tax=uncultured Shimia sp. TaxID=573152 RepID=UPI002625939D|nr:RNA polymerase sigma factor SigJ [uncultured Shimia sp.]